MKKVLVVLLIVVLAFTALSVGRLDGIVGSVVLFWLVVRAAPGIRRDIRAGWSLVRGSRGRYSSNMTV